MVFKVLTRMGTMIPKEINIYHNNPNVVTDRSEQTVYTRSDAAAVASDQGLHCLPLVQQYLNTSTDSGTYFFQFLGQVW